MNALTVLLTEEQTQELADLVATRLFVMLGQQQAAPAPLKIGYTIKEASTASGMTVWAIRQAIVRGELHAKQAGERGAYVIPAEALTNWLNGTRKAVGGRK